MADNTQAELRDKITKKVAASYGVAKDKTIADIMAIVRDWHNKQIEEVLDRLLDGTTTIHLDTQPNNPVEGKIEPMFFKTEIKAAIEAERERLGK